MEQLLQITSVPINYELKITHARLERQSGTADLEISRDKGGLHIKSKPVKLNVDSFDARNSVVPTVATAIKQNRDKGINAAYSATAQYASEGKLLVRAKIGQGAETIDQIMAQRTARPTGAFELGFIPSAPVEMSATEPDFTIEYEMDRLNFDWMIDKGQVDFIPGDVELSITQHPEVKIEYVGKPLYVPPSVAERFLGQNVDVKA